MNNIRVTVEPNNTGRIPNQFRDADNFYSLDLKPGLDFPMTFQHDNDAEGGDPTLAFSSTFVIEVPATAKNTVLLEDIGNPQIFNSELWFKRSLPGAAWVRGTDKINGFVVITGVQYLQGKPSSYEISVLDAGRFWVEALKGLRINNLNLGSYDYDDATVTAEMMIADPVYDPGIRNIWYPAIFRGELAGATEENRNSWNIEDFEPVPFLKFLIDQMFNHIGFRVVSEFFETKFFKKLGAEITENFGYSVEFAENLSAFIGYNGDQTAPAANTTVLQFDNESSLDNFYDHGNNAALGIYSPPVDILIDVEIDVTSNFNPPFPGGFTPDQTLRLRRDSDILWSYQETEELALQQVVLIKNISVLAGQTLFLDLINPTTEDIQIQQVSNFKITAKKFIPRGASVDLASYIDDRLFCWPLIKDVMKLFNMRQATDNKSRTIIMEPALDYKTTLGETGSGFYRKTGRDWSNKINICKQFSQRLSEPKRYFNFKFVEDTNDKFGNETKQESNNTSSRVHEERYDVKDDFPDLQADGEETLQLEFFATTRQLNIGTGTFVPSMTDFQVYDGTGFFGFFDTDEKASRTLRHVPRILYFKGWGRKILPTIFHFEGIEYSQYPIAFQASNYLDNAPNIAFDSVTGKFNGNRTGIFEGYHKRYLTMRNLNGITEAFALLSELDIIELDFREGVIINGNQYILKQVENWLANEPEVPTKVKLLLNRLIYSY